MDSKTLKLKSVKINRITGDPHRPAALCLLVQALTISLRPLGHASTHGGICAGYSRSPGVDDVRSVTPDWLNPPLSPAASEEGGIPHIFGSKQWFLRTRLFFLATSELCSFFFLNHPAKTKTIIFDYH